MGLQVYLKLYGAYDFALGYILGPQFAVQLQRPTTCGESCPMCSSETNEMFLEKGLNNQTRLLVVYYSLCIVRNTAKIRFVQTSVRGLAESVVTKAWMLGCCNPWRGGLRKKLQKKCPCTSTCRSLILTLTTTPQNALPLSSFPQSAELVRISWEFPKIGDP